MICLGMHNDVTVFVYPAKWGTGLQALPIYLKFRQFCGIKNCSVSVHGPKSVKHRDIAMALFHAIQAVAINHDWLDWSNDLTEQLTWLNNWSEFCLEFFFCVLLFSCLARELKISNRVCTSFTDSTLGTPVRFILATVNLLLWSMHIFEMVYSVRIYSTSPYVCMLQR